MLLSTNLMLYINQRELSRLSDDNNLNLTGYDVVRVNHQSNTEMWKKFVSASISKNSPLKVLDIQVLQECMNFETSIADKT